MAYYVRMMRLADVGQVTEIDREAFPTLWPPPNYKRELQNNVCHHIVAIDDTGVGMGSEPPTDVKPASLGIVARIKRWFGRDHLPGTQSKKELIIGFAGIWMMVDEAHITSLAVREKYRGQKIGELLLIALCELAVKLKARTITLEVRVSNEIAQSLYAKYGFNRAGLRRGYYTDNREDALLMTTPDITAVTFQEYFARLKRDYFLTSKQMFRENTLIGK